MEINPSDYRRRFSTSAKKEAASHRLPKPIRISIAA
jgi:hypothetical protein